MMPWLIHVNVWQNPLQYCKVIDLQLIKINEKKKEKNDEKAEKGYINEGTNYKHRNSNKWRGNRQISWKTIQNNDSKGDQKPWKQNGEKASQLTKT